MSTPTPTIPVLDLAHWFDPNLRQALVDDVGDAYRTYGFCSFINHHLDGHLVRQARQAYEDFFALPHDEKMKCHNPKLGGRRGFTPFGVETAKDAQIPDLKEFYHIGRTVTEITEEMPENIWPDNPLFRWRSIELYDAFEQVGRRILKIMSLSLGADEDDLWVTTINGNSILRALHYPALPSGIQPKALRAAPHEDLGFITLLWGASAKGLEVLDRSGVWIPVCPDQDAIVVNVGDMLQRVTNHVFPSTTHRVVNPQGPDASKPRYSLPFFMDPHPTTLLQTLPCTITPDNPNRYAPKNAHECLMERMREIKLQK